MDFRAGVGSLGCRLCGATYQMPIHHLHEPVDVFSEWLDDCEAAAQGRPTGGAAAAATGGGAHGGEVPQYESDSDDDLGEPSGLSAKAPAAAASAARGNGGGGGGAPSYSALGLDDSDDDSE